MGRAYYGQRLKGGAFVGGSKQINNLGDVVGAYYLWSLIFDTKNLLTRWFILAVSIGFAFYMVGPDRHPAAVGQVDNWWWSYMGWLFLFAICGHLVVWLISWRVRVVKQKLAALSARSAQRATATANDNGI